MAGGRILRQGLGHHAAAVEATERPATFAHRAGDWHLECRSLHMLGRWLLFGPTPASEGLRRCEEILAGTEDIVLRCGMRSSLSGFHALLGHPDEARRLHELALAEAEDLGLKPLGAESRSSV